MSKVTRRQVIRAGVAAGAALSAGTANAGPENEKPSSLVDLFLPTQLTKEDIQASKNVKFTQLEFAGSTFWLVRSRLSDLTIVKRRPVRRQYQVVR
jgi:hypothetical protein